MHQYAKYLTGGLAVLIQELPSLFIISHMKWYHWIYGIKQVEMTDITGLATYFGGVVIQFSVAHNLCVYFFLCYIYFILWNPILKNEALKYFPKVSIDESLVFHVFPIISYSITFTILVMVRISPKLHIESTLNSLKECFTTTKCEVYPKSTIKLINHIFDNIEEDDHCKSNNVTSSELSHKTDTFYLDFFKAKSDPISDDFMKCLDSFVVQHFINKLHEILLNEIFSCLIQIIHSIHIKITYNGLLQKEKGDDDIKDFHHHQDLMYNRRVSFAVTPTCNKLNVKLEEGLSTESIKTDNNIFVNEANDYQPDYDMLNETLKKVRKRLSVAANNMRDLNFYRPSMRVMTVSSSMEETATPKPKSRLFHRTSRRKQIAIDHVRKKSIKITSRFKRKERNMRKMLKDVQKVFKPVNR